MNSIHRSLPGDTVVVAAPDQVSADLDGEAVILHLGAGRYFGLGDVGARVWQLVAEPRTVAEIEAVLVREYDVEASECARDLAGLITGLADRGLIEVSHAASPDAP